MDVFKKQFLDWFSGYPKLNGVWFSSRVSLYNCMASYLYKAFLYLLAHLAISTISCSQWGDGRIYCTDSYTKAYLVKKVFRAELEYSPACVYYLCLWISPNWITSGCMLDVMWCGLKKLIVCVGVHPAAGEQWLWYMLKIQ